MQYQGLSGEIYLVEDSKIAGGGEGTIHAIQNNDKQVVKIFKPEKRSLEREEKLCYMAKTKLSHGELVQITWPQDVIYDQNGFAGYVMPKLAGAESLTTIYSAGTNNKYDLRYRTHIAINLCHAIQTVHSMGQVCGDLNPQNICVNLDINDKDNLFHVILVDTDSYHITSEGKTYRCEVGLADYIAPELQNKMRGLSLRNAPLPTYTKETDLFALAVHIFALLMNGCHPFACAKDVNGTLENTMEQMVSSNIKDSVVAPQPIENIKDGYFPFYEWKIGITTPVYAPSFEALSPDLQKLFVRSFVDGYKDPSKRVDTQEWIDVLMIERTKVISCPEETTHYYFGHYGKCPLCEVDEKIIGVFENPFEDFSKKSSENNKSDDKVSKPSFWTRFLLIGSGIVVAIMLLVAIVEDIEQQNNQLQYSVEEQEQDQYKVLITASTNYIESGDYDSAISSCDQAIALDSTKARAYYYKGKALYAKNELENALAVLKIGKDEAEYDTDVADLYDEVEEKYEEQQEAIKKEKRDNNRLKYGNKIIKSIKKKQYKTAVKLIKNGYEKGYLEDKKKIYIQNGKLVNKIKKGRGFVYYIWKDYAYIGSFKNGKPSGNGIEVGYPSKTGYDGYYTINGKFKNGYPNGKCTVYYSKYFSDSSATFIGTYKNGWENGSFTWIDKNLKGGHSDTYYFSSNMGTRKIIEMHGGKYVYAKAKSGWYWETKKKSLKNYSTEHHGKK